MLNTETKMTLLKTHLNNLDQRHTQEKLSKRLGIVGQLKSCDSYPTYQSMRSPNQEEFPVLEELTTYFDVSRLEKMIEDMNEFDSNKGD